MRLEHLLSGEDCKCRVAAQVKSPLNLRKAIPSHRPMAASLLRSLSFPIHWEILGCWGPLLFFGGLAQLARAPALQAGGQRFESVILHTAPHCVRQVNNEQ